MVHVSGVEVLSWQHCINQRMLRWVEANGIFVALDDFYEEITFLEEDRQPTTPTTPTTADYRVPTQDRKPTAEYRVPARYAKPIDLRKRCAHERH